MLDLIAFYNERNVMVVEEVTVGVYLDFSRTLHTISHVINDPGLGTE